MSVAIKNGLNKKVYVASLSGGQDSTAMTIKLLEEGQKLDYIIFCDTGNEFEEMYSYLDRLNVYLKNKFNMEITRLSSKNSLESLVFSEFTRGKRKGQIRGMPYSSSMSFCTRDLKKNVSDKFCKSLGKDVVMYLGYVAREYTRKHENDKDYITNDYPLFWWGWNEPEVRAFLRSRTLYNVLYDHFTRTGCKFCPKQSLGSWYALYSNHRADWNIALEWEARATKLNAHIKNFRSDYSLLELEERFEKKYIEDTRTPAFEFDWNDADVSCMCR